MKTVQKGVFGIVLTFILLLLLGLGSCSFSVLKLITVQIDHLFWKFLSKSQKLKEKRFTVQLICKLKQSSLISVWKWLRLIDSGSFRINITLILIWDQPKSTKVNLCSNCKSQNCIICKSGTDFKGLHRVHFSVGIQDFCFFFEVCHLVYQSQKENLHLEVICSLKKAFGS